MTSASRSIADYGAVNQTAGFTPGERMGADTATTVRDGRTLTTDGPFVETKEALWSSS